MGLVTDALDTPLAQRARVHCLSDGSRPLTLHELGVHARGAGGWLEQLAGRAGTVAALLTASHDCLAVFFGALRSGMTIVSLPHPARGMEAEEYVNQIGRMCALTGTDRVLCDPGLVELISVGPVAASAFSGWRSGGFPDAYEAPGGFVQFTSGSTGDPRGIELSLDALDANLTSMYDWLAPRDGAVVCSWLPLSHDMGLIGLALYAMCSVNPPWSVPSDLVLMTPEALPHDHHGDGGHRVRELLLGRSGGLLHGRRADPGPVLLRRAILGRRLCHAPSRPIREGHARTGRATPHPGTPGEGPACAEIGRRPRQEPRVQPTIHGRDHTGPSLTATGHRRLHPCSGGLAGRPPS